MNWSHYIPPYLRKDEDGCSTWFIVISSDEAPRNELHPTNSRFLATASYSACSSLRTHGAETITRTPTDRRQTTRPVMARSIEGRRGIVKWGRKRGATATGAWRQLECNPEHHAAAPGKSTLLRPPKRSDVARRIQNTRIPEWEREGRRWRRRVWRWRRWDSGGLRFFLWALLFVVILVLLWSWLQVMNSVRCSMFIAMYLGFGAQLWDLGGAGGSRI
jgi:hypothetical protein